MESASERPSDLIELDRDAAPTWTLPRRAA